MKFESTQIPTFLSQEHLKNSDSKLHHKVEDDEVSNNNQNKNENSDIKLSDFLHLMKIACHVNEMLANNSNNYNNDNNNNNAKEEKVPKSINNTISTGATPKTRSTNIDFKQLSENKIVNEILKATRRRSRTEICYEQNQSTTNAPTQTGSKSNLLILTTAQTTSTTTTKASSTNSTPRTRRDTYTTLSYFAGTSRKPLIPQTVGLNSKLNDKLDYVVNEGVLDSVLPFICPVPVPSAFNPCSRRKSITTQNTPNEAPPNDEEEANCDDSNVPKKFSRRNSLKKSSKQKELEVVIHVCDESKKTTRDFHCSANLLISKMGYFADVTAGQRLEDMDISVHCDVNIFEWLIKWMKRESKIDKASLTTDNGPTLDAGNVIPILVSASFLQMEPLLVECLAFCHARLGDIVRLSANLGCLNDVIVTRLAAMFTNMELENIRDKRDRLTPKLWAKFIQSLCEPDAEVLRGHFFTMAGLFRCIKCQKYMTNTLKTVTTCIPSNVRLNRWGEIVNFHEPDPEWNINQYIVNLYKEMKSWRRVYWHLWGQCHFLYCCLCDNFFPVYQMLWCRFHPENPNFIGPIIEGHVSGPHGRFPCCGQPAFRFQAITWPDGCTYREHTVLAETDHDRSILAIAQFVGESFALYESPPPIEDFDDSLVMVNLKPKRLKQGLLPTVEMIESQTGNRRRTGGYSDESESESESSDGATGFDMSTYKKIADASIVETSDDGCESEDNTKNYCTRSVRKKNIEQKGRNWSGELSARSNQDHQRDYEEKLMNVVNGMVREKIGPDHTFEPTPVPISGMYSKLEAEWKDELKRAAAGGSSSNSNSTSGSSSGGSTQCSSTAMSISSKSNVSYLANVSTNLVNKL